MNSRIKNILTKLEQENLDGLILSSSPNISYLSAYKSRDSYLLILKKENIYPHTKSFGAGVYFTDSRYIEEARNSLKGYRLQKVDGSVFRLIADACKSSNLKRIGFEERHLPFAEYKRIKSELARSAELVPTHDLVETSRQIKTADELKKIKQAIEIAIRALKFSKDFIRPGKKEIEVAGELERFIRYHGASSASFNIIVASGPNSSFPHHVTSQKLIRNNELVLVDLGVEYLGYKSDLTRVFFLGKINSLVRRIYAIVKEAQGQAIQKIKPAVAVNKVDAAARQYIIKKGYGGFFGHSLGHGIGLEVHEAPRISAKENTELKPGMVFTVEPAIYLPAKFGIRIEDMVLVTNKGCEVLSGALDK